MSSGRYAMLRHFTETFQLEAFLLDALGIYSVNPTAEPTYGKFKLPLRCSDQWSQCRVAPGGSLFKPLIVNR